MSELRKKPGESKKRARTDRLPDFPGTDPEDTPSGVPTPADIEIDAIAGEKHPDREIRQEVEETSPSEADTSVSERDGAGLHR